MADTRYWAFISYSHKDGGARANWLHRALEFYRLPRKVVGRETPEGPAPRSLRPVFRDRAELAASPDLRARVQEALEASRSLIVLCSPGAAISAWVSEEIERFKALRGSARIFAVIAAGSPNTGDAATECFPAALRRADGRAELIAADLRPGGDGRRLARLKLVAGILGLDLDDLVRRDAQRRARWLAGLTAGAVAISLAMAALAVTALLARNEARVQRAQAESLVAFMLGDLRKKLEPSGRLDLLDDVAKRTLTYYAVQAPRGLDDDALGQRARAMQLLGELDERRGNLLAAQSSFEHASAATAELLARKPHDRSRLLGHVQSLFHLASVAQDRGDEVGARAFTLAYRQAALRLWRLAPSDEALSEFADATEDLGILDFQAGRPLKAVDAFRQVLAIGAGLAAKAPMDRDRQAVQAQYHAWLADAYADLGRLDLARSNRQSEIQIYQLLLSREPNDSDAVESLIVAQMALAKIEFRERRPAEALAILTKSAEDSRLACRGVAKDEECEESRALLLAMKAKALLALGRTESARTTAKQAVSAASTFVLVHEKRSPWQEFVFGSCQLAWLKANLTGHVAERNRGKLQRAARMEAGRLAVLARARPGDDQLHQLASEAAALSTHNSSTVTQSRETRTP